MAKRKTNRYWSWLCLPTKKWQVYYTSDGGVDWFICEAADRGWARKIAKLMNAER